MAASVFILRRSYGSFPRLERSVASNASSSYHHHLCNMEYFTVLHVTICLLVNIGLFLIYDLPPLLNLDNFSLDHTTGLVSGKYDSLHGSPLHRSVMAVIAKW